MGFVKLKAYVRRCTRTSQALKTNDEVNLKYLNNKGTYNNEG